MTTPILKSSKFWIAFLDATIATVTMTVTLCVSPENAGFVLGIVAAYQPVLILLIHGLTVEEMTRIKADSDIKQAQAYAQAEAAK
jgi:hypothetical protein